MVDSQSMSPDLSTMIQAARNIVFTARRQDQLSSLTVKSVRKQVARDFGLDEAVADREDVKLAIRSAVKEAVAEELSESGVDKPVEKRKRSPADVDGGSQDTTSHGEGLVSKQRNKRQAMSTETGSRKKSRVTVKSKKLIDSDDASSVNERKLPLRGLLLQNVRDGSSGSQATPKLLATAAAPTLEAEKSESELSVLIDQPPKQKRTKKKAKDEATVSRKPTKRQKQKEPVTASDQDEATIKRLKSFVSACGVRKVWSKEFSALPMAKQQIKRLKEILAEVGMTGRYSMERAKTIREKRELARELDDVLEYERKAGASQSKTRQTTRTKHAVGELDTESDAEGRSKSRDSSETPVIKRSKNTASKSIMAYLANQSSDDD